MKFSAHVVWCFMELLCLRAEDMLSCLRSIKGLWRAVRTLSSRRKVCLWDVRICLNNKEAFPKWNKAEIPPEATSNRRSNCADKKSVRVELLIWAPLCSFSDFLTRRRSTRFPDRRKIETDRVENASFLRGSFWKRWGQICGDKANDEPSNYWVYKPGSIDENLEGDGNIDSWSTGDPAHLSISQNLRRKSM